MVPCAGHKYRDSYRRHHRAGGEKRYRSQEGYHYNTPRRASTATIHHPLVRDPHARIRARLLSSQFVHGETLNFLRGVVQFVVRLIPPPPPSIRNNKLCMIIEIHAVLSSAFPYKYIIIARFLLFLYSFGSIITTQIAFVLECFRHNRISAV